LEENMKRGRRKGGKYKRKRSKEEGKIEHAEKS
jgi:hypothetical protein